MDKLNFSQFVRYTLSAGIALVVIALAYPAPALKAWHGMTAPQGAVLGLMLLIAGTAVYGIHRSLLHPVVLRIALVLICRARPQTESGGLSNLFKPTSLEIELVKKWRRGKPEWADLWASRTHSLYCSAWVVGAITALAPYYTGQPEHPGWLARLFWVVLVAAFLEDIRLNYAVILVEIEGGPATLTAEDHGASQ